jgi:glycosyltransferase involved in cell wall biosynthesis
MSEVTFIISARNEYPQIVMTIDNLMNECWQAGIDKWEVIIADNGSFDFTSRFWRYAWLDPYAKNSPTQRPRELQPSPRGMAHEGRVRFCYDPVFSNVGARDKAVKFARYENIIFCDGHISVKPNSVKYMLETLDKFGGVVHAPVAWMGASVYHPHPGMQYTYKLGEKIWGTWNYAQVTDEGPFYIPVYGHCFIAVKKKEYEAMGGYDTHQRVYGGGENYLDTLYWMMGSTVMVDPRALVFHLSAGRGYSYDSNSLIHNMMLTAYTLGGHKWSERILVTYLNKAGIDEDFLFREYAIAIKEGQEKRDFIEKNKKYTLEEVLAIGKPIDCDGSEYKGQKHARRIWDTMNDKLWGHHISFVVVYENWLNDLKRPIAKDFFANSPYQK